MKVRKPQPQQPLESTGVKSKMSFGLKTKGELSLDDLPPIEQLQISVSEGELVQVGVITSVVEQLIVVQGAKGMPALDIDTLLFVDGGKRALGRVFDVLGPVAEPLYAVRFNSEQEAKDIAAAFPAPSPVYCAPNNPQHTAFVFLSQLLK